MNQPFSASNPNGTPTALSQFTNNQWLGTGAGYDANGNATAIPGTTNETFTYDGENRVATANANGTITYVYDGEGRRVSKAASTFTTNYLYDAFGKVVQETTIPVTGTSYPTQAPFTGTEYPIRDHLGSTRVSLNSQGQVVRRWDFLPFGEEIVAGVGGRGADYEPSNSVYPATPDAVLRKFTGKERDAETGLDYFGARYFSGAQGRFTSPDWSATPQPIPYADLKDPQTLNLYAYVRNNPLSRADADGHCPPCVEILESPMVQEALEEAGSATVGMLAGAYIASQESVQNVARDLGDYIATHPPQTASQQDREDLHNLFNPAKQSSSEKVPGPVKAKDAPGVTAGGQATDEHGNKLGGSGKPQVHETESNTREGAKNKALNEGSGAVEHTNPKVGKPHFHPSDAEGNKKPTSVHHNYPDN